MIRKRRFVFWPLCCAIVLEGSFEVAQAANVGINVLTREWWYSAGDRGERSLCFAGLIPWPKPPPFPLRAMIPGTPYKSTRKRRK
jgi:hypothetical protein